MKRQSLSLAQLEEAFGGYYNQRPSAAFQPQIAAAAQATSAGFWGMVDAAQPYVERVREFDRATSPSALAEWSGNWASNQVNRISEYAGDWAEAKQTALSNYFYGGSASTANAPSISDNPLPPNIYGNEAATNFGETFEPSANDLASFELGQQQQGAPEYYEPESFE